MEYGILASGATIDVRTETMATEVAGAVAMTTMVR